MVIIKPMRHSKRMSEREVNQMAKSIIVDRVKVIAEMARQDLTGEELAQKAGVGRSAVIKMRKGQPVWRTTAGHVATALGVPLEYLKEVE
nr:MAG TPA: regulatory protein [Caudoviricetes sp.]